MTISNNKSFDIVFEGYNTVMTFIMSISIFIISFKLENILKYFSKVLYLVGDNTLGIYLIHAIVGWSLIIYYRNLHFSFNILSNIMFGVVVLVISLIISIIIRKLPILKNLLKI